MKDIKINYNTFATTHSRDYYRGQSFHFAGKWTIGTHYISDDYQIDFVTINNTLLVCAKSHLSSLENKPVEFVTNERGDIKGVISKYWDFVCSGINGKSPGLRVNDNNEIEYCEDTSLPEQT